MSLNCLTLVHRKIESVIFSNQLFKAFDIREQAKDQTFALDLQYYSNEMLDYENWQVEQSLRVDELIDSLQAAGKNMDGPWVVLLEANYGQPAKGVFCHVLFEALQIRLPGACFVLTSTTNKSLEFGLEVLESFGDPSRLLTMNPIKKGDEDDANQNILTRIQAMSHLETFLMPALDVIVERASTTQEIEQMPPDLKAASSAAFMGSTKPAVISRRHQSDIARGFFGKGKEDGKAKKLIMEEGVPTKASDAASSRDEEGPQIFVRQRLLSQFKTTNKGKCPEVLGLAVESPDENVVINDAPAGPSGQQTSPTTKRNGSQPNLR